MSQKVVKQGTKTKRVRITREEIEKAKRELLNQTKEAISTSPKIVEEKPKWKKDFWYGLVYCDPYGHASIVGENLEGVWLGKTEEFIPYLESKGIDGEDVDEVLQAFQQFRSEKKLYSCHLATENNAVGINTRGRKSIVAIFKKDPHFLRLLNGLISQGLGIRAIHSELKGKGYKIPMRTLGRWVRERRDTI